MTFALWRGLSQIQTRALSDVHNSCASSRFKKARLNSNRIWNSWGLSSCCRFTFYWAKRRRVNFPGASPNSFPYTSDIFNDSCCSLSALSPTLAFCVLCPSMVMKNEESNNSLCRNCPPHCDFYIMEKPFMDQLWNFSASVTSILFIHISRQVRKSLIRCPRVPGASRTLSFHIGCFQLILLIVVFVFQRYPQTQSPKIQSSVGALCAWN